MFKESPKGLPDNVSELQAMVINLHEKFEDVAQENELLRKELRLMRLKMFTRISERFEEGSDNIQRLLFEDIESEIVDEEVKPEDLVIKEHNRKKPGRKPQTKSHSWVFRGGLPAMPGLYYHYAPSRSGKIAKEFLNDYRGYIQTDGYAGYNFLDTKPGVIHCGCWAHVRRKFNEVVKAVGRKYKGKGKANHALSMIRDLYLIEREAKSKGLDEEQTYQLRQERSKPIVDKLEIWLRENAIKIPPQSLLGKAFNYTLNQWPRLIKFLENGLVRMDNNLVENAIRPFVVGRKN
jgi:hypothetical protein